MAFKYGHQQKHHLGAGDPGSHRCLHLKYSAQTHGTRLDKTIFPMHDKIMLKFDQVHLMFDKDLPPVARIRSGDTITLQTERADCMMLGKGKPVFKDRDEVVETSPNPVTGPIFIDGAEPGDFVRIFIKRLVPCPDGSLGYVTYVPGPSALVPPFSLLNDFEPETIWVKMEGDHMTLPFKAKPRTIEIQPMIGTIGTAPKRERVQTYWSGRSYGGNMDCPLVCEGNEVVLPVNVPGALVSLGDVHARQGDGEVSCCAVECRGEAEVRIEVLKPLEARYFEWPQVNGPEFIGSVGCVQNSMEKTVQAALIDLVKRVELHYGFRMLDAYQLVAQCVELRVCQAIFPHYSCLAKIEKRYL
jgi:acetamidase/formamidase